MNRDPTPWRARPRRHHRALNQVYCSVGTHPHHAHEEPTVTVDDLIARTRHPKVVAIGEAGLDHHYDFSSPDAQEQGFRNHIAAARATGLPFVIHSREAHADMARLLEDEMGKGASPAPQGVCTAVT